jgi:hypothetical protein
MANERTKKESMLNDNTDNKKTAEEWVAIHKEAGLRIDPETADVMWKWGESLDPYGIYPDLPQEWRGVMEKNFFARSSGSDVWVSFDDIPDAATRAALEKKLAAPDPVDFWQP